MNTSTLPSALLFLAPSCNHCPMVLDALVRALKEGRLKRLEAVDLISNPEEATRHGVRTVPWLRIGPFELSGALTSAEVRHWIDRATEGGGWADYYAHLIEQRQIERLVTLIRQRPGTLIEVLGLVEDPATTLSIQIGCSVLFEELAGDPVLASLIPQLEQLTWSERQTLRADACHFLGLTGDPLAIPAVERLLDDADPDVREIAGESLGLLRAVSVGTPTLW